MKRPSTSAEPIRVAHIILGLQMGGEERLLVEMARHRDAARFEWTVIVLGPRGPLADDLEAAGVAVTGALVLPGSDDLTVRPL